METTQQATLTDFLSKNHITIKNVRVDGNPNMDDWKEARHWLFTLKYGSKRMRIYFSQGAALTEEPTIEDVLDCLASDASSVANSDSFEDWTAELGYNADSRRAEKTFETIVRQARQLKSFLGEEQYKELLWNTERL